MIGLGTLHKSFVDDRSAAESAYLGEVLSVEATVLRTGTSIYETPIVEASDVSGGELLAVFVLPFGHQAEASFARLDSLHPAQRLRVTGECRLFDDADGVLVFKDCVVEPLQVLPLS